MINVECAELVELTDEQLELVGGAGWWQDTVEFVGEAANAVQEVYEAVEEFIEEHPKVVAFVEDVVETVGDWFSDDDSGRDPYSYTPAVGLGSGV